ncbi:SCY1 protein kinase [Kwoniella heveanensis CBS 569]|nr:SCY1 protein kinase [Kwoniella heveanensis CBS 569]
MFAAASNLFNKTSYLSAYNINTPSPSSSAAPSPSSSSTHLPSNSAPAASSAAGGGGGKSFNVGLWKVLGASHKTTGKEVSVWVFEKRVLDGIKAGVSYGGVPGREWVVEQLKKEASSLSRLRHPDILHMVEPLEESRSELTFITERVTSSLSTLLSSASGSLATPRSGGRPPAGERSREVDLDEVEIQKGTLQLARGLGFLHGQAKMVHLNLGPEAVLINSKGDWKLSGLALTTPLTQPDGTATKYVYPEVDQRLPPQVQWKLDYLAPEYALDSTLTASSDLYSLGCLLYAVHMGGKPPFVNRGSMQSLRDNAEGSLARREWMSGSRWERCSSELKDLLPRLLTRHPANRISLASLPSHPFFSSLAISTLNFLDPTTFASKPREEKATFLRGLVRVLPTFSERLRKGKVLPSLLEEMKDPYLLPFILPNVFEISKGLNKDEFATVLPRLQPLFVLKDPPQNMLTLLEHLSLFEEKTTPPVFRESVMPLIYNSLECEHMPVQERVLKTVPHLCEILDYGTVQNVLLVKVAILFTRTRILSVKVQTLECFTAMVKTLDKATLTTKLVPLLAKIKTREPAVMMATLAVHEAMGAKVDREAIATLVLPQLWAMSMGPLLNADQFGRFMNVVKTLGARVEQEHSQHLRDVGRIEAQTASLAAANAFALNNGNGFEGSGGGEVDFETLVRGGAGSAATSPNPALGGSRGGGSGGAMGISDPWEDEGWLNDTSNSLVSSFNSSATSSFASLTMDPTATSSPFPSSPQPSVPSSNTTTLRPTTSTTTTSSRLKARPVPSSSFNASAFQDSTPKPQSASAFPALSPTPTGGSGSTFTALQPSTTGSNSLSTLRSGSTSGYGQNRPTATASGPNYNLSLSPQAPHQSAAAAVSSSPMSFMSSPPTLAAPVSQPQYQHQSPPQVQVQSQPPITNNTTIKPPPGWQSGLMQPTSAAKPVWGKGAGGGGAAGGGAKGDWGDFDPLG